MCTLSVKQIYQKRGGIPIGKCKENTGLLANLSEEHGDQFIQNTCSALGITYNNNDSLEEISYNKYTVKIEKAKSWIEAWSKRNLTLLGKVTIIKSLEQERSYSFGKSNHYQVTYLLLVHLPGNSSYNA